MVSIIIPNYNGAAFLEPCIHSILEQDLSAQEREIIVIDNGSTDASPDLLAKFGSQITVIANRENLGFTGAINQGVAASTGKLLLLFNNDAILGPNALSGLIEFLNHAPVDVAAVQPLLLNAKDPARIDSAGIALGPYFRPRDDLHGQPVELSPQSPCEIWGACAACVLLKRGVFDQAGGFDLDYFFDVDDVDFAFRVRWLGYRFMLAPQFHVLHHRSPATKKLPSVHMQRHLQNYLITIDKDMPGSWHWRLLLYRFQHDLFMIPHHLRNGSLKVVIKAWCFFISQWKNTGRKRKIIMATSRFTALDMKRQLLSFVRSAP
ncbi:MAG: glycosyltransferase family 2 protein [Calditrichota bacterium]